MSTSAPPRATTGPAPADPAPRGRDRAAPAPARLGLATAATVAAAVVLATCSLLPLLEPGWMAWPVTMTLVVVGVGAALTWVRAPAYLVPVLQAVAGLVVLLLALAPDPTWGPVPTPTSLERLRAVLQEGMASVQSQTPPVAVTPGILGLVTIGVGVVAMATYVLAGVVRLPLLAGLPLLGLYLTPAAVLDSGSPAWAFVLTAAGWLAILVADARDTVGAWGRGEGAGRTTVHGWVASATRIGVVALAVAVLVPPLVPGVLPSRLGGSGTGQASDDDQSADSIKLDPFVSLRRDLQRTDPVEVFTYSTDGDDTAYLRTVVADTFDGEKWIPRTFDATTADPVGQVDTSPLGLSAAIRRTTSTYQFFGSRLDAHWLPLPSPVSSVTVDGDWRWDTDAEVAFSTTASTQGTSWQATALEVQPTFAQLAAVAPVGSDDPQRGRQDPGAQVPDVLKEKAAELTAGITSPYEQALAIQWWLRDNFRYSLDVHDEDPDADQLTAFLTDRVGYCQQFAATMALMTRSLGITSRVAVGFTTGTRGREGVYHVSTNDAHAWPELFFAGIGWVRFEPTPRSTQDSTVDVPAWASQDDLDRLRDDREAHQTPVPTPTLDVQSPTDASSDDASASDGAPRGLLLLGGLVLLGLLAAVPSLVRTARRRRRLAREGAALAEGAWAELGDIVRDVGGEWPSSRTPRQTVALLAGRHWATPEARAALERIGGVVERARYARDVQVDAGLLAEDLRVVRDASTAWLDPADRMRVKAFPRTVVRAG